VDTNVVDDSIQSLAKAKKEIKKASEEKEKRAEEIRD